MDGRGPAGADRGGDRGHLGGAGLVGVLERWAAELRAEAAADARSRERWLRQQSAEEARFAGALTDLAERASAVVAHTQAGGRLRGRVVCVGADFVALETDQRTVALVRQDHVTAVRANSAGTDLASDRTAALDLDLAEALRALAEDRPRVRLTLGAADSVTGELRRVGADVATLRLEGDERATLYVRLAAITEVLLV
jgi:hypothetical protein